jgi:hypothetical protein
MSIYGRPVLHRTKALNSTRLTLAEVRPPVPPFEAAFQAYMADWRLDGQARTAAERRWQQLADLLTHSGRDPNWRRRASVLDQLRGWKRQPVMRKRADHDNLKAAA